MANQASVPYGIGLVRPAQVLQPFVRYYAHRNAHLVEAIAIHRVHARAAPILILEFGDANSTTYHRVGKPPILSPRAVLVGIQTGPQGELHIRGTIDSFNVLFQPDGLDLLF